MLPKDLREVLDVKMRGKTAFFRKTSEEQCKEICRLLEDGRIRQQQLLDSRDKIRRRDEISFDHEKRLLE